MSERPRTEGRRALFVAMLLRAQAAQAQAGRDIALWMEALEALKKEAADA